MEVNKHKVRTERTLIFTAEGPLRFLKSRDIITLSFCDNFRVGGWVTQVR